MKFGICTGLAGARLSEHSGFDLRAENEDPVTIREAAPFLFHVHISSAGRTAPDTRNERLKEMFHHLRAAGYDSRISFECTWSDDREEPERILEEVKSLWSMPGKK